MMMEADWSDVDTRSYKIKDSFSPVPPEGTSHGDTLILGL